jgi:hypothetical protein
MNIFRIILVVVFVSGLAASAMGFDGNGSDLPRGFHGNGAGDGTGPIYDITGDEPSAITGTVAGIGAYGGGIQIDTGTEIVTVYGVGPLFYWESLGVARPGIGEAITVNAVEVTFSDESTKIVALSIIIGEETLQLRDEATGVPLWRLNQQRGGGAIKQQHRSGSRNQMCPGADAETGV